MTRHTWAGIVAFALVFVFAALAAREPVPYVTFSPGPTVNVLGEYDGDPIISVEGREAYRDDGGLRLTTVVPSGPERKVSLAELVLAWVDKDRAVYPYEAIYRPEDTRDTVREESGVQMVSSQDNAVAAALRALDIDFETAVRVATVDEKGPSAGKLEPGDLVLAVDGKPVRSLEDLTGSIRPRPIGTTLTLRLDRAGTPVTQQVNTVPSPSDPTVSAVRVEIAPSFRFPFEVDLDIDDNIGGPSGGLMFALGIYDVLTPGSLTDGRVIAGTGEIDAAGTVGSIGGIQQKIAGAQDDGARLFLVPADNCAEALAGDNHDPDRMRLMRASTLEEAISGVRAWAQDPTTELPRCTR